MKKSIFALLILTAFGLSGIIPEVYSAQERGYISVSTSANTEVTPDVAELSFAVITTDTKSMQKASALNKEISDKVLAVLASMLNSKNGDFIKTSDFNASPIYSYSSNKRTLDKYEVSNRVIVHTKSTDKVGEIIDKAIEAGATNVSSLTFSVSNYDSQCNELLGTAAKKAQDRAGILAKKLSTYVEGVRTFDVSCSTNNYNVPRAYLAKNMMFSASSDDASSEGASTSISSGLIKIYANVNASFFVK